MGKRTGKPPRAPAPQDLRQVLSLINAGRFAAAEPLARACTDRFPRFAKGWHLLGIAGLGQDATNRALPALEKATRLDPRDADAWRHLGQCLSALGEHRRARDAYAQAVRHGPRQLDNLLLALDNAVELAGLADIERLARQALLLDRNNVFALNNLGLALLRQGRAEEAIAPLRETILLRPDHVSAHLSLGQACEARGLVEDALAHFETAWRINPAAPAACLSLGALLQKTGRQEQAIRVYDAALAHGAYTPGLLSDRASALLDLGRGEEAEEGFVRALEQDPVHVPALVGLGLLSIKGGAYERALRYYARAAEVRPDAVEVLHGIGAAHLGFSDIDTSLDYLRRAVAVDPGYSPARNSLLFALNYHPELPAEDIFAAYRSFDSDQARPHRRDWKPFTRDRAPDRRLRIGYLSADYYRHSVRHFLFPLLASHDRERFEVTAYSVGRQQDDWTDRFRAAVDRWVPATGWVDDQLAERIRSDGIDILVDLSGHTDGNRLMVFARKPAPVSVSWLGFGYTTGVSAIDWFLTDAVTTPAGCEHLFSETPWRVPGCSLVYRPDEGMADPGPLPARSRGFVTFASLSRTIRLNFRVIAAWARLLDRVPGARLRIDSRDLNDEASREQIARRFAAHGIGRERLELGFHSGADAVLRELDISLDCFPHNSGTTLFESLYMGVPYVTLAERPPVGRLGASILTAAGHPEWVAATEEDYIEKAVALASDLDALERIRATLRPEMEASPLMDEAGFARRVEAAYRAMWHRFCEGGQDR